MVGYRRARAFTLVELLVVIAIIGILVSLLLPAVQAAREAARRMQCSNNLKQFGLALHNYHDTYKAVPFGHMYRGNFDGNPNDAAGGTGFSWGYALLPYLEQQPLADRFNPLFPITINSGNIQNLTMAQTPLGTFACPSDVKPLNFSDGAVTNSATSSYRGCGSSYTGWAGNGPAAAPNLLRFNGLFDRDNGGPKALRDILDGTTNQFAFCEARWKMDANQRNRTRIYGSTDNAQFATGASNALMVNGEHAINWTALEGNPQPHRTASSFHPGGAQFTMADGSVRFVSETIHHTATPWIDNANAFDAPNQGRNYGTYQRLFSMQDGLVVGDF